MGRFVEEGVRGGGKRGRGWDKWTVGGQAEGRGGKWQGGGEEEGDGGWVLEDGGWVKERGLMRFEPTSYRPHPTRNTHSTKLISPSNHPQTTLENRYCHPLLK